VEYAVVTSLSNKMPRARESECPTALVVVPGTRSAPSLKRDAIFCHNGICFNCGLDKLKNKEKLYRWEDD
jgi:hypothetical protein